MNLKADFFRRHIVLLLSLVLFVLNIFTHFAFYGQPKELVFDEVYFGRFASGYLTGSHYFDIHPPLGKLVISGFGYLNGIRSDSTDYELIGNEYSGEVSDVYRFLPAFFASLIPVLIFHVCLSAGFSKKASFFVGILLTIENSLIVHSRFTSLDSMLLFFGFASLLFYLQYIKDTHKKILLIVSAIFVAAAVSIKWTGLAFPLIIMFMEMTRHRVGQSIIKFLFVYTLVGIVFYMSVFAVHFALLDKPGTGDAFMVENFQEKSFIGKFIELNTQMYLVNANLDATHQYSSKWYSWPVMARTVFYWEEADEGRYIYYIGNVLLYWLGTISVLILFIRSLLQWKVSRVKLFVIVGYLANWLPFILIGRVMFIYHYAAALIFSIMAIGLCIEEIGDRRMKNIIFVGVTILAVIVYWYFSPLTYGLPLTEAELMNRMWLPTWR